MKKLTLTASVLCVLSGHGFSANLIKLNGNQDIIPQGISFKQSSPELKKVKEYKGHVRYQQMINGIPVYGHQIIHHEDNTNGHFSGHWIEVTADDQQKLKVRREQINDATAMTIAKQHYEAEHQSLRQSHFQYSAESSKLHYILNRDHQLKSVFVVSFFVDSPQGRQPARPFYLIDANTASIIRHWNGLTTDKIAQGPGGNQKTGRYEYGREFPLLDVTVKPDNTTCVMSNENVETINLNHALTGKKIFDFTCPYHSNDDEINGGYSPLNDAHFFGGVIFSMYQEWYKMKPLSFKLKMQVHYGNHYENAFWDGRTMNFGDGDSYFYPLLALDVAAHEISHGVTEQNSGLEYWGESGGLNESFSDMAGKTAEFFLRGKNSWAIGEDITKDNHPIRYMDRPERDGNSIGDARDFAPSLNVHFSSGVFNRMFYKLATTPGWNTRKAFEVMLNANLHYWEPETNFAEAAEGVIHAAQDLHDNTTDVIHAAKAVGIHCESMDDDYSCRISSED